MGNVASVKNEIISFMSAHVIAVIAWVLALITMIFVPPDHEYATYIDTTTLGSLFCLMAAITALRNVGAFEIAGAYVVRLFKNTRACVAALVGLCFFGSMVMTNDVALLTFLPLAYLVLKATGETALLVKTFTLQTIAANLGGMILPFGNPQNLYLYTYYAVPTGDFVATMLPPFLVSLLLIVICCIIVPRRPLNLHNSTAVINKPRLVLGLWLFAVALAGILRIIPWPLAAVCITAILLVSDRKALKRLDWGLLLTFVAFFIFAGNVARIPEMCALIQSCMAISEFGTAVFTSQVISNVPAAMVLSQFTTAWQPLLVGVNVGGVGTPLGSLASLITINEYIRLKPEGLAQFMRWFLGYNFAYLALLVLFCLLIGL